MKIAVIVGSDSDLPILKGCLKTLKEFGVPYEVAICSAHRTPDKAAEFSKNAEKNGFGVIIAAAGKAAHLPGVIAAQTILPVIGIPVDSGSLGGLDALLSIVQMPSGVPVASVSIDGAVNAALLAVSILALADPALKEQLRDYKIKMAKKIDEKNAGLSAKLDDLLKPGTES